MRRLKDLVPTVENVTNETISRNLNGNMNSEFISSLKYAAILQKGILPKPRHFNRIFDDSFVLFLPQHIISGDFYWLSEVNDDLVYVAVGDCTGHGVPGAMLSILGNNMLTYAILKKRIKKVNRILMEMDKRFIESFSSDMQDEGFNNDWMDISLCCIDRKNKMIHYAGAKQKAFLVQKKGIEILKGSVYPLGGWQISADRNFESKSIAYKTGDTLYLSTDGFQDQIGGPKDKKYKSIALRKLLEENASDCLEDQKNRLLSEHLDWKGANEQTDDICLIGLRL
ncbi:MAG: PP2C family protein-serine/threonine phosphatase [Crocinitomicaceae bacterium]